VPGFPASGHRFPGHRRRSPERGAPAGLGVPRFVRPRWVVITSVAGRAGESMHREWPGDAPYGRTTVLDQWERTTEMGSHTPSDLRSATRQAAIPLLRGIPLSQHGALSAAVCIPRPRTTPEWPSSRRRGTAGRRAGASRWPAKTTMDKRGKAVLRRVRGSSSVWLPKPGTVSRR
jgi:hypothetical protein